MILPPASVTVIFYPGQNVVRKNVGFTIIYDNKDDSAKYNYIEQFIPDWDWYRSQTVKLGNVTVEMQAKIYNRNSELLDDLTHSFHPNVYIESGVKGSESESKMARMPVTFPDLPIDRAAAYLIMTINVSGGIQDNYRNRIGISKIERQPPPGQPPEEEEPSPPPPQPPVSRSGLVVGGLLVAGVVVAILSSD